MKDKKLYILPISNINDVSKSIYQIKSLLKDTEHEIHVLTNSIAIYISKEDKKVNNSLDIVCNDKDQLLNYIEVSSQNDEVINKNSIYSNNNYYESSTYISTDECNGKNYIQFMHDVKMIQRTNRIYL